MPTASDFRTMASSIESFESFFAGSSSDVAAAASLAQVTGGELADLIERAVEQSALNIVTARTRLGALADMCRERAAQCDRYTQLYAGYDAAVARYSQLAQQLEEGQSLGSPPYPPLRPGPWADRG